MLIREPRRKFRRRSRCCRARRFQCRSLAILGHFRVAEASGFRKRHLGKQYQAIAGNTAEVASASIDFTSQSQAANGDVDASSTTDHRHTSADSGAFGHGTVGWCGHGVQPTALNARVGIFRQGPQRSHRVNNYCCQWAIRNACCTTSVRSPGLRLFSLPAPCLTAAGPTEHSGCRAPENFSTLPSPDATRVKKRPVRDRLRLGSDKVQRGSSVETDRQ